MDETRKPEEDPGNWTGIEAVANASEAAIVVGFLQNHDIPARMVDRSFHQTPTTDEDLTPIEVAVPTDRLEEARAALARRENVETPEGSVLGDEGPVDPSAEGSGSLG
jgi:hypothetical protein